VSSGSSATIPWRVLASQRPLAFKRQRRATIEIASDDLAWTALAASYATARSAGCRALRP